MNKPKPGSIRGRSGSVSIWRVPNYLLEARGYFLPHRDRKIERLTKIRALGAGVIVIGMVIHYGGLAHTGFTRANNATTATTLYDVNTPEGAWLVGIIITIMAAVAVVPVVGIVLALTAERGYRRVTFWQMRWVVISFFSFFGLFAAIGFILKETYNLLAPRQNSGNLLVLIGLALVALVALVFCVIWGVRSMHLIADGMFRADDAHPLLGPVSAIPVVWATCIIMYLAHGDGGLTGVPDVLANVVASGGAATLTGLSVYAIVRLRHDPHWPFRRGPVQRPAPPPQAPYYGWPQAR